MPFSYLSSANDALCRGPKYARYQWLAKHTNPDTAGRELVTFGPIVGCKAVRVGYLVGLASR